MLTEDERAKFADYLEQSAATDLVLIEQLKKLPGQESKIKKMNVEAMAARVISYKLRGADTETV